MLTSALFTGYSFGIGSIVYNLTKIKMQNDFEEDLKKLREYNLEHETINVERDLPAKCMLLIRSPPLQDLSKACVSKLSQDNPNKFYFTQVISFSNLLDPTMYFHVINHTNISLEKVF